MGGEVDDLLGEHRQRKMKRAATAATGAAPHACRRCIDLPRPASAAVQAPGRISAIVLPERRAALIGDAIAILVPAVAADFLAGNADLRIFREEDGNAHAVVGEIALRVELFSLMRISSR